MTRIALARQTRDPVLYRAPMHSKRKECVSVVCWCHIHRHGCIGCRVLSPRVRPTVRLVILCSGAHHWQHGDAPASIAPQCPVVQHSMPRPQQRVPRSPIRHAQQRGQAGGLEWASQVGGSSSAAADENALATGQLHPGPGARLAQQRRVDQLKLDAPADGLAQQRDAQPAPDMGESGTFRVCLQQSSAPEWQPPAAKIYGYDVNIKHCAGAGECPVRQGLHGENVVAVCQLAARGQLCAVCGVVQDDSQAAVLTKRWLALPSHGRVARLNSLRWLLQSCWQRHPSLRRGRLSGCSAHLLCHRAEP